MLKIVLFQVIYYCFNCKFHIALLLRRMKPEQMKILPNFKSWKTLISLSWKMVHCFKQSCYFWVFSLAYVKIHFLFPVEAQMCIVFLDKTIEGMSCWVQILLFRHCTLLAVWNTFWRWEEGIKLSYTVNNNNYTFMGQHLTITA